MAVKKKVETRYVDDENRFEYLFEPVEDTITVDETPDGYTVKYLAQDEDPPSPDEMGDGDCEFLVHYHRQFNVENKNAREELLADYFRSKDELGVIKDNDEPDDMYEVRELAEKYWIFPVTSYIHSGVVLKLGREGFAMDSGGWDTSRCGAVLVRKTEFGAGGVQFEHTEEEARTMAESVVEEWNQYLSGDVYGIVQERFDKNKKQIGVNSYWGFYGLEYAIEALREWEH